MGLKLRYSCFEDGWIPLGLDTWQTTGSGIGLTQLVLTGAMENVPTLKVSNSKIRVLLSWAENPNGKRGYFAYGYMLLALYVDNVSQVAVFEARQP